MSVLIKGMNMPTCCAECDLHNPFSETPYCRRLLQVIPLEGRLDNCPLVEVKTPHGRLIDADEMSSIYHDGSFDVKKVAKQMNTVIEAEE